MISGVRRYLPLLVILAAFIWACVTIALRRTQEAPPGAIVIRIGHWQLETGARDAFVQLGKEFAALPEVRKLSGRRDVRIVQEAVPEGIYPQWLTSQLMAQMPPDLVEIGILPKPILIAFQNRYFVPLNDLASEANPFNAGTPLQGKPLKETLTDGMRSGYQEELQSYMRVPLSRFSERLFYNRTLLRKLTGLEAPPGELRAFLALCQQIGEKPLAGGAPGSHYTSMISSSYHIPMWFANMADPLTYANLFNADFTRDGAVGTDETYAAIVSGRMSLLDFPWRAKFSVGKSLCAEFQPGFIGVTRDEALFLFAQQKGVFMCTGTWDVNSLIEQAQGKFEVGIAKFPFLSKDDPEYGRLVMGPVYDPADVAFPFGVTRFCKHPEIAKAFLQFLASYHGNAELNRIIGWIPSVVDVPPPPALAGFKPVDQGIMSCGDLALGGQSLVEWNEALSQFESEPGETVEDLVRGLARTYKRVGLTDWDEQQRDWRRGILLTEQTLAAMRGEALVSAPEDKGDPRWLRYRSATTTRQVFPEISHQFMQRIMTRGPDRPVAPYAYLPEALAHAAEEIKHGGGGSPKSAKDVGALSR